MIKIQKFVQPSADQMDTIVKGVRNSYKGSEIKADSYIDESGTFIFGEADLKLLRTLLNKGSSDRKFLRMMPALLEINAPLYFWKEFDTYKVGTTSNSESSMHSITTKPFELDDFSREHLYSTSTEKLKDLVDYLNQLRNCYIATKDPDKKKSYWWQIIQLLPSSYNQKRTVSLNYEVLLNIYNQRKNHKLDEWLIFCDWIEENLICY